MSAGNLISQFTSLAQKAEALKTKVSKTSPTDAQWDSLLASCEQLSEAAGKLQHEVRSLRALRALHAWEASTTFREEAQYTRSELIMTKHLKRAPIFRRNIRTIFDPPKLSQFDTEGVKSRKVSMQERCALLRALSCDGLISWALAFTPTTWAAGSMAQDVFLCVLDEIEPDVAQRWPTVIHETLQGIMEENEELKASAEYVQFLGDIEVGASGAIVYSRKRKRQSHSLQSPAHRPRLQGNREMKYMYTNAPALSIRPMLSLLSTKVPNSGQWKIEREQGLKTTACLAALFPKDSTQDVSFNIWCGHDDGYDLINQFGMELAFSA